MDKEFIKKYCESVYPELEVTAVKCNDKYQRLKKIFEKRNRKDVLFLRKQTQYLWRNNFSSEDEFEKELGDRKLFRLYEELLSDYMAMEHEMAISVYLLGAEDREKMLR